jgi:hypothetical protein
MRQIKVLAMLVIVALSLQSFMGVSLSSDKNWYNTELHVTIPPGESVTVTLENGRLQVTGKEIANTHLDVPEWMRDDFNFNMKRLSKSAQRLSEGAYAQVCYIIPEKQEVIVVSGHENPPVVIDVSDMKTLNIIPRSVDSTSKLAFADINYDGFSDLIVCPRNGGWYWLEGPSFAVPKEGNDINPQWGRNQLHPLTNPALPTKVEFLLKKKNLAFLNNDGEIDGISRYDGCFGSISSLGLIFADRHNDLRYMRMANGEPLEFSTNSITLIPEFSSETHLCLRDDTLYAGRLDGTVDICKKNEQGNFVKTEEILNLDFGKRVSPLIEDFNLDGEDDFIWTDSNGVFISYGPDWKNREQIAINADTTIAVGDLTEDFKPEILVIDKGIPSVYASDDLQKLDIEFDIEGFEYLYPAIGDVNGDNKDDVVFGTDDGKIEVFLSPDWRSSDLLSDIDIGSFSYPYLADFDGDDRDDLLLSNVFGETFSYRSAPTGWEEYHSWKFIATYPYYSILDYYSRYYSESPLLYWCQDDAVSRYDSLLEECPPNLYDEVAFCIAHTPANVLRTIVRMGQEDIFIRNAQMIYKVVEELNYVKLKEYDDFTTCVFRTEDGEVELPREDYYWYVVHPRTLFELPVAVDASWWEQSYEVRDMEQKDWWTHEVDSKTFYEGENRVFWREGIYENDSFGETVVSAVGSSSTLNEAITNLHKLIKHNDEDSYNIFGYLTGDLYPWHIFMKHYGSCGEQSQLFSSCAKTVLIPNYIVINMGEDHQWNEVWSPKGWTHFDVNMAEPMNDARKYEHGWNKTVSTVIGWRPDDYFFPTTSTVLNREYDDRDYISDYGYTDTASVDFNVFDVHREPVEGAMIFIRSGWRERNAISFWGYTNANGKMHADLGYEPYYIIDCITPYGTTGLSRFVVEEGISYNVNLNVPGVSLSERTELESVQSTQSSKTVTIDNVSEYLHPPNRITSYGYRLGSYLSETYGYRGIRDYSQPVIETSTTITVNDRNYSTFSGDSFDLNKGDQFTLTNPTNLSWKKIDICAKIVFDELPSDLNLSDEYIEIQSGKPLKVDFDIKLPTPIDSMEWSWNGKDWNILNADQIVETGTGGAPSPGEKELHIRANVLYQNGTIHIDDTIMVSIRPTDEFIDQPVSQDPSDPLDGVSWQMGPFSIPDNLEYFLITTSSKTISLDLDIFLYQDKNKDGNIDKDEMVASSTLPSSDEKILLKSPDTGVYYLLCQGCRCPEGNSRFNVRFSSMPNW